MVVVNNATEAADLEVTSRRVSLLLLEHSTLATVLEKKVWAVIKAERARQRKNMAG